MQRAPYRVHKLIQDLNKDRAAAATFRADPEPLFDAYKLEPRERTLLRDGSLQALCELGVQSNLQMKLRFLGMGEKASDSVAPPAPPPLAEYMDRLLDY
jgi:hypothetical protein